MHNLNLLILLGVAKRTGVYTLANQIKTRMKNPHTHSYTNFSSGMLCRTGLQHFWGFPLALDKYFFFHNRFNRCSTEDTCIVDLTPPFITSTSCFNSLFLTTIFILTTPPTSSVHETTPFPFPFGTILLSFANLFFFCF